MQPAWFTRPSTQVGAHISKRLGVHGRRTARARREAVRFELCCSMVSTAPPAPRAARAGVRPRPESTPAGLEYWPSGWGGWGEGG